MLWDQLRLALFIVGLTVLSGFSDAQGALYAAKVWQEGKVVWLELGRSALGFGVGISLYWIALRYMSELGIVAVEVQVIIWFGVMLIGVSLVSGMFFTWPRIDQGVALLVLVGIIWLSIRTGQ
jgi:hypothetical protein